MCSSRTSAPWASREGRQEDRLVFFTKTCARARCRLPDTCQAPCSALAAWWTLPTTQSEILLQHADLLRRKPEVQKLESGHQAAQVKCVHLYATLPNSLLNRALSLSGGNPEVLLRHPPCPGLPGRAAPAAATSRDWLSAPAVARDPPYCQRTLSSQRPPHNVHPAICSGP